MTMYRGYELEQKPLMVGWQIAIRKDDAFVCNGRICKELEMALTEARGYVDTLMSAGASGAVS